MVRPGCEADLDAVARIQSASPEAAQWDVREYLKYDFVVALCGESVAGFAVARRVAPDESELLNLAVDPAFRRRGIARRLVSELTAAHAGTLIDDSGTLPANAALAMRWRDVTPRSGPITDMIGTLQLHVRLNVAPWLRHSGHIYLVLPAQQPGAINASWTTQGRLLPGQVSAGSRALVYSGPITSAFIEDVVTLTITVDGRRMSQTYPVNFRFEMDEN